MLCSFLIYMSLVYETDRIRTPNTLLYNRFQNVGLCSIRILFYTVVAQKKKPLPLSDLNCRAQPACTALVMFEQDHLTGYIWELTVSLTDCSVVKTGRTRKLIQRRFSCYCKRTKNRERLVSRQFFFSSVCIPVMCSNHYGSSQGDQDFKFGCNMW